MTSMPASRSTQAMTLEPRSWPSRPTLATRTRILRSGAAVATADLPVDGRLTVLPVNALKHVAHLSQGHVVLGGLQEARHEVLGPLRGGPDRLQRRPDLPHVALPLER